MSRILAFLYGVVCYVTFFIAFCYLAGFMGNLVVPKSVDSGNSVGGMGAYLINLFWIALFGIQHSIMARPTFKRWWTKFIPRPIERSTFVLITSLILMGMYVNWQPLVTTVWDVADTWLEPILWILFAAGWVIVLSSSYMINHFDLFGLRQVTLYLQGKEYTTVPFKVMGFYHWVRNPLMLGFIIAMWSAPVMTQGHLLFSVGMTLYIFIGIYFEERNIAEHLGDPYIKYRRQTSMILPIKR